MRETSQQVAPANAKPTKVGAYTSKSLIDLSLLMSLKGAIEKNARLALPPGMATAQAGRAFLANSRVSGFMDSSIFSSLLKLYFVGTNVPAA